MIGALYSPTTKAFVSYSDKQIHVWNELTGKMIFRIHLFEETKSHCIASMCYSEARRLYFVIATDFKMHVFNENLICVDTVKTETRLVHRCQYYDKEDIIVTAGVDGCVLL